MQTLMSEYTESQIHKVGMDPQASSTNSTQELPKFQPHVWELPELQHLGPWPLPLGSLFQTWPLSGEEPFPSTILNGLNDNNTIPKCLFFFPPKLQLIELPCFPHYLIKCGQKKYVIEKYLNILQDKMQDRMKTMFAVNAVTPCTLKRKYLFLFIDKIRYIAYSCFKHFKNSFQNRRHNHLQKLLCDICLWV